LTSAESGTPSWTVAAAELANAGVEVQPPLSMLLPWPGLFIQRMLDGNTLPAREKIIRANYAHAQW